MPPRFCRDVPREIHDEAYRLVLIVDRPIELAFRFHCRQGAHEAECTFRKLRRANKQVRTETWEMFFEKNTLVLGVTKGEDRIGIWPVRGAPYSLRTESR